MLSGGSSEIVPRVGTCEHCGCQFRTKRDQRNHCCDAMQEAESLHLVIAVYWTDDKDAETNGNPSAIKGSGAVVTMTPETVDRNLRKGMYRTLVDLNVEDALDWWKGRQA